MCAERTQFIHYDRKPLREPKLAVIVVNSRGADNPWFKLCLDSVKAQTYPKVEPVIVDNNDHSLSIGAAYNAAVRATTAELCLFLGDDDMLACDFCHGIVHGFNLLKNGPMPDLVHVSTNCIAHDERTGAEGPLPLPHMGMFTRKHLEENPFDEELPRGVGRDAVLKLERGQRFTGKPKSIVIPHLFGYVWRQHIGMAGGMVLGSNALPAHA